MNRHMLVNKLMKMDQEVQEENIAYLNDILGLTLVDVDQEVYVGSYRCDLVAKDETNNTTVIVENQLHQNI